ncbi:MAG: response regulator [Bdellovibrionales bacterium]
MSLKILLAEDDSNISTIAKLALEKLGGHQVTVAPNGEVALKLALDGGFDLILLDEMMPKLNGVNVCKRYLSETPKPVPVIFLSAKSQDSDIREFHNLARGYIAKPFDPMQLNQQIAAVLAKHSGAA